MHQGGRSSWLELSHARMIAAKYEIETELDKLDPNDLGSFWMRFRLCKCTRRFIDTCLLI